MTNGIHRARHFRQRSERQVKFHGGRHGLQAQPCVFGMNIAGEDGKDELKRKTPDGRSRGIHLRELARVGRHSTEPHAG